jgi:hypothetical protein
MKGDQTIRKKLSELVSDANADNWWRPELFEQHTLSQIPSTLEIVTPPPTEEQNYNCFVYVLGLQHDERFLGNKGWIFTRKLDELFDEMIAQSILERIENGDSNKLIVYRADSGKISHVGLMEDESTVISKWSWGPLLRHKIFDVPNHYGSTVEFYAMSEKVKDFVVARI